MKHEVLRQVETALSIKEVETQVRSFVLQTWRAELDTMSVDRYARLESVAKIVSSDVFRARGYDYHCNEHMLKVMVSETLLAHRNKLARHRALELV